MADDPAPQNPNLRMGREGSRWWNQRPASEEVAEWFKTVPLHAEMKETDRERYIGGIVLIEQKVKTPRFMRWDEDTGIPIFGEDTIQHQTYTPYPKVETRVQYFHDLMAIKADEWVGVIEPVGGGRGDLPPGFSARTVPHADRQGKPVQTRFVICSMKVTVFDKKTYSQRVNIDRRTGEITIIHTGTPIVSGAPGTKMVPLLAYPDKVDPFSVMKAETGAVGRALGMAGMLVVPGAGVATAEDMREAGALESAAVSEAPSPEGAPLPPEAPQQAAQSDEQAMKERAVEVVNALRTEFPDTAFKELQGWARDKGIVNIMDQSGPALKGAVKKAEKVLDQARREQAAQPEPPEGDEPPTAELPAD